MATDEDLAYEDLRTALSVLRPLVGKKRPYLSARDAIQLTLFNVDHARKNLLRALRRDEGKAEETQKGE